MLAYEYKERGRFELVEKPMPQLQDGHDAIVRVTLGSICTSDLHIKHGSVPRAVPGITVGHEMVGVVEQVGKDVKTVKHGDRVTVNVETFCGECFFCRHGFVNNCTDPNGGCSACRPGTEPDSRYRDRRTGAFRGRHLGYGLLGGKNFGNYARRHGADYRCRSDGSMCAGLHTAETSETDYRV